ncbi:MAG TPA: nucleotide exchange factor GrpE [Opitutaceae bacterium]
MANTTPPPAAAGAPGAAQSQPTPAPAVEPKGASLEEQLAAAKKEAAENHERYLRSVADLENFRRRTVREKDELRQFAASRVLEDLLPVIDNLALGLAAARQPNAELKTLVGGIEMVGTQLKTALTQHGLKEINPVGQPFDPNLHESIAQAPSAEIAEGNVLQVVRTGYSLNGRLLRPASVVVSGGPAKEENR